MKSKRIEVTLKKAKEWYNSGNSELKSLALSIYTEDELAYPEWRHIKSFGNVCDALNLSYANVMETIDDLNLIHTPYGMHSAALYKIDLIRKALNKDANIDLFSEETVYCPILRLYKNIDVTNSVISQHTGWKIETKFDYNNQTYYLVSGDASAYRTDDANDLSTSSIFVSSYVGLFGCASEAIAKHMSKYFWKYIFEVCYGHQLYNPERQNSFYQQV